MGTSPFGRLYNAIAQGIDRRIGWYRLPVPFGILTLIGLRSILRERNLVDVGEARPPLDPPADGRYKTERTEDGTFNDLSQPRMGSAGARFGRNVPLAKGFPQTQTILSPNPRAVSQALLTRETFIPATSLNLLVAAWIQFMIHGWFSHGKNTKENPWQIPLAADDPWPEHPMTILRTRDDPTRTPGEVHLPPTHTNETTHWWDGSQLYGSDDATLARVRSHQDGKLVLGADGLLPIDPATGVDITGVNGNWWVGLVIMHTLFTLEHNAICDHLRKAYPDWSDDDLFAHARLVNTAVMAKIHTIQWTPAILAHPTLRVAMNGNWWGLAGQRIYKLFGRISRSEIISGIPGSATDNFGVPYSLTEEFVSVYRMHPLLPDEFAFRSAGDDHVLQERDLASVVDRHAHELAQEVGVGDLLYSFGVANPGAITLRNYPRALQQRREMDGSLIDLATIEILRDRERGVPRYNEFRRLMHRRPVKSFKRLSRDREIVKRLRQLYNDDIEQVDLMIGMFAERPPKGFGFSDTAFRIFILMASRRLNSDRFFTSDYNKRIYSRAGMDWVVQNDMTTVLLRHFPALRPALRKVKNPFAPWRRVGEPSKVSR